MGRVTLTDIAKLAGVSRSAAGKVLNGSHGDIRVAEETRERIEAAARQLNYRPNMAAAILAGGRSNLIGVMAETQNWFRNRQLLQEIERVASLQHHRLMVCFTHDNIADMCENYNDMHRYGVCGVICLAHDYPQFRSETEELFRDVDDVVFMEQPHFPAGAWVGTDNLDALIQLFGFLRRNGRRKIALIHGNPIYTSESQLRENYRIALERNGIPFRPELQGALPDSVSSRKSCEFIIETMIKKERPDALFVDEATFALCIQSRLQYEGWRIPEDLILCGGNGDPLFAHAAPAIFSLDPHYEQIAAELVNAVLRKNFHSYAIVKTTFLIPEVMP